MASFKPMTHAISALAELLLINHTPCSSGWFATTSDALEAKALALALYLVALSTSRSYLHEAWALDSSTHLSNMHECGRSNLLFSNLFSCLRAESHLVFRNHDDQYDSNAVTYTENIPRWRNNCVYMTGGYWPLIGRPAGYMHRLTTKGTRSTLVVEAAVL